MGNLNCKSPKGNNIIISPPKDFEQDSSSTTVSSDKNIDVAVEETTISSSIEGDDFVIPIKIYLPSNNNNITNIPIKSSVLFIHGGIFSSGDCHSHPTISEGLAKLGLAVVTASFRNGEEAPHKTNITMRDLRDVIDFVRMKWKNIPFGLAGSSSGGFFALTLSQTLGPSIISFCIPICPVANPFKRASYLRSSISGNAQSEGYTSLHDPKRSAHILEKQLSFWVDDQSMIDAGDLLKSNQQPDIPTLLIIGSADKNVPFSVTNDVQSWATRTIVIGGKGHELCDKVVEGGGYHCYLPDIDRFLDYCLAMK